MMTVFWTAVVVCICGHTLEIDGTAGKDEPASLTSTVTPTTLPTIKPTEDESVKLVVRACIAMLSIFMCISALQLIIGTQKNAVLFLLTVGSNLNIFGDHF